MNRTLSKLGPGLLLAVVMVATSALVVAAPREPWTALAAPLLLVLGLIGADLLQARSSGRRARVSSSTLLLAVAVVVSSGIVASRDLDRLAGLMPILGACAAAPVLLRREGARTSCRRF